MPRYIDADRLIKGIRFAVCTTCAFDYNKEKCRCDTGDCITYIEDCPTADVQETKHGRWINVIGEDYVCSNCKAALWARKTNPVSNYKYCWSCGAKMDGDAE